MSDEADGKTRMTINVTIPVELRVKLIELGISPADVAKRALMSAVSKHDKRDRKRNRRLQLEAVQRMDPRVKDSELATSARARRLRRIVSVKDPTVQSDTL